MGFQPSLSKAINQIQKTRKAINNNQRRYPDDDEIVKLTGLSLDKIRSASNCLRVVGSVDQKISDCFSGKHMVCRKFNNQRNALFTFARIR